MDSPFSSVRVARRFVAGLGSELERRMKDLLAGPLDAAKGRQLGEWLEANFHFLGAKTPRGGKELKEDLNRLHWYVKSGLGQQQNPEVLRESIESAWEKVQHRLGDVVKLLSDEGGTVVPKDIQVGGNTYLNLSGFSEAVLSGYVKALEQVFDELKGWRKKALKGGLKVALAGPKEFRGTSAGKYKSGEDTLYVRATPQILKRTHGTYGAFDYILVHEIGHRYSYRLTMPHEDFDRPNWWTSRYSHNDGEAFAELFAISNFALKGPWDQAVVERFEALMTGSAEAQLHELPAHLQKVSFPEA